MDGLLVVDKPSGPTSHDVVARLRRVLRERRIGHTGTLDPLATGVLPLVIGRATRLARFLSGSDKTYEAVVRLGFATDTCDAEGMPIGLPRADVLPTKDVIDRALAAFRGQFLQSPPAFSAKKIAGERSYHVARRTYVGHDPDVHPKCVGSDPEVDRTPLAPASVTVRTLEVTAIDGDRISLRITCSAGFYVRALARDLGERLGTGAHLVALRRTRAGELTLDQAIPLADAERDPTATAARVVPLARMLTHLPAMTLDAAAVGRTVQGRDLESPVSPSGPPPPLVRLLDEAGDLVAVAEPSGSGSGLLHPSVVLR